MSDHVVSGISESGMVENVGVAAEIASPSLSVQKLFPLPVRIFDILRFMVTNLGMESRRYLVLVKSYF